MSFRKVGYYFSALLLLLALIFISCNNTPEGIDLTKENPVSLFEVFSKVWVVELETNAESLVSEIEKVVFSSSKYFVLDVKSQQLLWFDKNGRFINKISAKGKGPGEYNYITDFTIDTKNNLVVLLDPVVQRIHYYCFDGSHVRTIQIATETVMGFNKVFVLNNSTLLVSSVTYEQLVFIDSSTGKVKNKEFRTPAKVHLEAFMPDDNIYQLEGETFVMPGLSQDVFNVTSAKPVSHYRYIFGVNDNSPGQINALVAEIDAGRNIVFPHEGVGPGNFLNHHFYKVFETKRFHLAILEFENNFIQVVIDKTSGNSSVFRSFEEGISLLGFSIQPEYAIGFERGLNSHFSTIPGLSHRSMFYFDASTLSEIDRQFIANHNPMTDNPFLVVYKFKE